MTAAFALEPPSKPMNLRGTDNRILAEITAGLAAGGDLDVLLQRFLESVIQLAGAQGGAVRVLDDGDESLELISEFGLSAGACSSERSVDRHCGHCGEAADQHALVWAENLDSCSSRNGGQFFGQSCQRLLAVPLQHRGEVLGVYNLFFEARQPAPSAGVMALLRSVGELLGLALNHARLERAQLQARLVHERQMMAAEVHDSLGQSLAFIKMRLPLLEDALGACDQPRAAAYCQELRETASQAHASLRSLLTQLRAPMDPQGLTHALDTAVATFRHRCETQLHYANELPALNLPPDQEGQVFHIVQEALSNVARHAGARQAWLRLERAPDGGVAVTIADDGQGLPRQEPGSAVGGSHYGLEIMVERARRLGGSLSLGARPQGGTEVTLHLPAVSAASPLTARAGAH